MDNPSIKLPDNELAQPEAPVTLPDLEAPAAAPKVAPGAIPDTVPEPRPTAATEDEPTPAAVPPDTGALPDTAYRDYSTPLSQRHPTESQVATPLAEPTPDFDPDNSTATFNPGYSSVTDRDDYVQSALNRGIQPYQMPDKDLSREMFRAQNPDLTWGSLAMGGVKFTGGFVGKVFNPVEYWNSAKSLWPLFNGAGGAVYNSMIYEINKLPDIPAIGWEPSADKERTETSRNKLQGTWLTLKQNLQTQLDNLQISNSHLAGLVYRTVLRKADEHDFTNDQYDYFIKHQKVTEDVNQALAAGDIQKAIKVGYGGEGIGGQVMTAWGPVTVGPEPGSKESEQDAKKYATQQQLKAMGYSPKEVSEMGEAMTLGAELPLFELVPAGVAALPARGVVAAIPKVVRTGGKAMQAAGWMADHAARKAGWVSNLGMATGLWHGNPALMVKSLIGSTVVKPMLEQLAAKLDSLGKHVEYAGTRVGMGPSEEYVLRRLETEAGTAPTLGNMFLQSSIKTIQKIGASGAVLTAKGIPLYLSAPSPYEAGQQAGGLFDLGALTKSTGLGVRATFIDGIAKTPGGPKAPLSSKSFNYGVDPELDTAHNSETESWAQENRDNLNRSRHALQGSAEVYAMPSDLFEATYGERAGVYLRGEGGKPATIIYNGERGYEAAKAHEPSHVIWDKILTPQQKEEIIPTLFKLNNPSQFASNYYSLSTGNPVRVDFDSLPQSVSDPADPLHATKDVVLSEMFADALRHYSIDQITVNPGIMRSMQYGIGKVMESMGFPVSPAESTGFLGLQPSATALFTLENSMRQIAADQVSVGTNYGKPLPPDPGIHFKDVRDALRALGYSATDASTMASNAIGDARALGSRIDVTPEVLTKRALTGKFPPDAIWQQGKAPTNAWEAEANKLVTEFKDQGIPEEQAVIQAADVMQDREKLRRPAGQGIERKIPQQQQYMLDVAPEAEGFRPDFYSRAAQTLQANPQKKWSKDQLLGFLKGRGISENEMEWSGLKDLPEGSHSKEDVLNSIQLPQVIETQLSDSKSISVNNIARDQYGVDYNDLDPREQRAVMDNFNSSAEGTHYSNPNLNLPGGTNYRELLFQLEHPEPKSGLNPEEYKRFTDLLNERYTPENYYGRSEGRPSVSDETGELKALRAKHSAGLVRPKDFETGHFEGQYPNTVAHARVDDRVDPVTGGKMLFMQEGQWDWGHAIWEKGGARPKNLEQQIDNLTSQIRDLTEPYTKDIVIKDTRVPYYKTLWDNATGKPVGEENRMHSFASAEKLLKDMKEEALPYVTDKMSGDELSKVADLFKERNDLRDLKHAPSDMPFKGDAGKKYLFRQIIKHAVQEGYDSIGWTTGEQQAARYDLSKHVDEIIASTAPRLDAAGQYQIRATDKEGNQVINKIFHSGKEVEATFGKELASKIVAHDDVNNPLVISGTDLKVGGEGKKQMYDVMFPKLFNELGKKFGARTEDAVLPSPKRELQDWEKGKVQFGEDMTVHRLPITPEMRASVQEQGQPMFMPQPGNPEALKGAAIKLPDGRILVGGWHGAIDRQVPAQFKGQGVDGFVTNSGRFLTRDEAWVIGKRLGQIPAYARPLNKDQLKLGEQTRPQLISEDIRPPAYMPEVVGVRAKHFVESGGDPSNIEGFEHLAPTTWLMFHGRQPEGGGFTTGQFITTQPGHFGLGQALENTKRSVAKGRYMPDVGDFQKLAKDAGYEFQGDLDGVLFWKHPDTGHEITAEPWRGRENALADFKDKLSGKYVPGQDIYKTSKAQAYGPQGERNRLKREGEEGGRYMPQINVGLERAGQENLRPEHVIDALRGAGIKVTNTSHWHPEGGEPTLVVSLDRHMTQDEGKAVAKALGQQAIPQYHLGKGEMFVPEPDKLANPDWANFNPDFFLDHNGYSLTKNAAKSKQGRTGASGIWDRMTVDPNFEGGRLEQIAKGIGANPKERFYRQTPAAQKAIQDYFTGRGEAQFMPNPHPDAIKEPAWKMEDGRVISAPVGYHSLIPLPKEYKSAVDRQHLEAGFVTNKGEFLNREQAFDRALKMDQLSERSKEFGGNKFPLHTPDLKNPEGFLYMPDNPMAIDRAAIRRKSDGEIITGGQNDTHFMIPATSGKADDYLGINGHKLYEEGFVSKAGYWYDREQAHTQMKAMGQLPPNYQGEYGGEANVTDLRRARASEGQYMPNTPEDAAAAIAEGLEKHPEAFPRAYEKNKDGSYKLKYDPQAKKKTYIPVEKPFDLTQSGLYKQSKDLDDFENKMVDRVVQEHDNVWSKDPEIMQAKGWYDIYNTMREKGMSHEQATRFLDTAAATSARARAGSQFIDSLEAHNRMEAGDFDEIIKKYKEAYDKQKAGDLTFNKDFTSAQKKKYNVGDPVNSASAFRDYVEANGLVLRKTSGKRFGMHSYKVLQVMAGHYVPEGLKYTDFFNALTGRSTNPVIDIWSYRNIDRLANEGYKDVWRRLPENEPGVNDVDYLISRRIMQKAAKKLGYDNPTDLQAIQWFGEKKQWFKNKWARELDLGDYRPLLNRFTPIEGARGLQFKLSDIEPPPKKAKKAPPQ